MSKKVATIKRETKYFKVSFDTNIEGFAKHSSFYTTSDYFNVENIRVQICNAISRLNLPYVAKVENISASEITAPECSGLLPIETIYQSLKDAAYDMKWRMEEEELKRTGCKHIKLAMFFKKLDDLFDYSGCDE